MASLLSSNKIQTHAALYIICSIPHLSNLIYNFTSAPATILFWHSPFIHACLLFPLPAVVFSQLALGSLPSSLSPEVILSKTPSLNYFTYDSKHSRILSILIHTLLHRKFHRLTYYVFQVCVYFLLLLPRLSPPWEQRLLPALYICYIPLVPSIYLPFDKY